MALTELQPETRDPQSVLSKAPDFNAIRSRDAQMRLVEAGGLVPVFVYPLELGGTNSAQNTVYVTPAAADSQSALIQALRDLAGEGVINQLKVAPVYHGHSLVPAEIVYQASHSDQQERFTTGVVVWEPEA